jgi:hypothetical protein
MMARARGRRGEPILGMSEDRDSPATALHGGASLASGKSGGGTGQGSRWLAPGLRGNVRWRWSLGWSLLD